MTTLIYLVNKSPLRLKFAAVFFVVLAFQDVFYAQQPVNNLTFNIKDTIPYGRGANNVIFSSCVQQDGKILLGGVFTEFNSEIQHGIARINPDCTIDNSFYTGTAADNGAVLTIKQQPDGKILLGGTFTSFNGVPKTGIVRLNTDGTIDNTFNTGTGFTNSANYIHVNSIDLQFDGKIIVGGFFENYDGASSNSIARLNTDGSLDTSFNIGTGIFGRVNKVLVQQDGKIILSGSFNSFNGFSRNNIVRINNNGVIDNSFTIGTGFNSFINTIELQADGKILAAGDFTQFNGVNKSKIARLNSNGTLDNTMNCIGYDDIYALMVQPDGKILVGGHFLHFNSQSLYNLVRIQSNGAIDPSFNPGTNPGITRSIQRIDTAHYLICGPFNGFDWENAFSIVKLELDGSLSDDFSVENGANNFVSSVLFQSDNKILIGGGFTRFNGKRISKIARLMENGDIDTTFLIGSGFDQPVNNLVLQPDGKILVTGYFGSYDSHPTGSGIARLNSNGTLDSTFNPPSLDGYILAVGLQNDGKIIIGGSFTQMMGNYSNRIARLNSDGSIDSSFDISMGADNDIKSIIIQNDGKILLGGAFFSYNGNIVKYIVRLNSDGSTDNTFVSGADGQVTNLALRPDGKIIVAGAFTAISNTAKKNLAIIESNGLINNSFDIGTGTNNSINTLYLRPDNKILVGGSFTTFNGVNCGYLVLLNENGTIDQTFNSVGHAGSVILSTCLSNENILVGGEFKNYNGQVRNHITKLVMCEASYDTVSITSCGAYTWPINTITYSNSGIYTDTILNYLGCDSIVTIHLIIDSLTISNSFSMPSDANSCVGEAAVTVSGNADFELDIDNGSQVVTSSGYSLITNLCPGIHDLHVTDNCGDTLTTQFVIPVDSNYVFNNPFIDSLAADSLGVTVTNCDIYYAGIDTAYIDSIWANGNTVNVIWNIVDSNGSNFDTTSYVLNNGNGVYWLQLSVFCPNKSVGEYFAVTEAIYFNNGSVSTAGLADYKQALFEVYPNPTNNQVIINFSGPDAELTVYDLQGKVVLKDSIQNQETISLENFERGVYLFDLRSSNGKSIQRVVKQ